MNQEAIDMTRKGPSSSGEERALPHGLHAPMRFGIGRRIVFSAAVIGVLVFVFGGWAATAELSGAVISHGTVVVDGRAKKVQHKEGGIVAAINVRNGDRVAADQVLAVLDDTQTRAELGIIRSQLNEVRARRARAIAERNRDDAIAFPEDLGANEEGRSIMKGELRVLKEARETRARQKEQLELRITQLQKEIEGVGSQRQAKTGELSLIEKELKDIRDLYQRKLTPATRLYGLEREQTRLAGEYGSLTSQLARLEGQISEIRLQVLGIDQTAAADAQREVRDADARLAELREREIAQRDRLGRMEIRSPQAGVVHELAIHTIGGVVTPAEPVMTIVPDSNALNIEVRISPAEIDQVHVGQPVRLRFTSFNQRTTPEKRGSISYVSADISQDPKTRAEFYVATAALDDAGSFTVGDQRILPGMPVEAFITTSKRTAISYLLKPLTDQVLRTFREE